MRRDKIELETDLNGNVIVPRYDCVTSHTARRTGITNMDLSHKYTILQMMHVSGHKTQKTFMDYIKLSSDDFDGRVSIIHHNDEPNRRRDRRYRQRSKSRSILINMMPDLLPMLQVGHQVKLFRIHSKLIILCPDLCSDLRGDLEVVPQVNP